ncbi:hypothetical protein, partial [Endozoicomonas sp.]|uniref:hypothetical protein n=1 Tax=Endozoicomonas sp. TaxID=1892382 RepID=UPI00383B0DBA
MGIPSSTGTPQGVTIPKTTQNKEIQKEEPASLVTMTSFSGRRIVVIETYTANTARSSEIAVQAVDLVSEFDLIKMEK